MPEPDHTRALLTRSSSGDRAATDQLVELLYEELREIAHRHLLREPVRSLRTTSLVHEAYLRLARGRDQEPRSREHFLALASRVIRHVLVDRARSRQAEKRGGGAAPVTLPDALEGATGTTSPLDILALDRALDELAERSERLAQVVECRFFGGMTMEETASALGVSKRTVEYDWKRARAYLYRALRDSGDGEVSDPSEAGTSGEPSAS